MFETVFVVRIATLTLCYSMMKTRTFIKET